MDLVKIAKRHENNNNIGEAIKIYKRLCTEQKTLKKKKNQQQLNF